MILSILTTIALLGAAGDGATYIRAGNVFDGETFLGPQVVVVRNGRIEAVEESGFRIPAGASVIDATDATVMPGLIDGHVHFMEPPKPYTDNIERYGQGRLEAEAMSVFANSRRHLLLNGVTATADMGGSLAAYHGLRAALDKGGIIGPEFYFSGPQITAPGGHPAGTTYTGEHDLIDLATLQVNDTLAARKKVAALARDGVDFISIVYDQSPYQGRKVPRLKLEVAEAAIAEAHRHRLKAFASVGSEAVAMEEMIRAGADGVEVGVKTSSDSLLRRMVPSSAYYSPWGSSAPWVVGTDFPASGEKHCGDDIFTEMRTSESTMTSRISALKAATSEPALMFSKADRLGRVAPGCEADLVFLRGSADTGALSSDRIERVMLSGKTVVQDGQVCADCAGGFRETSLSYLGYPYWDPLLSWLAGATATDYDLFRTGITAEADVLYSIRNMWFANAVLDLPSPIPRTALRAGMHFDNQNRLFYGLGNDTRLDSATEYSNLIFREWVSGRTRISGAWKALSYLVFDQTTVSPYGGKALADTLSGHQGGDEVAVSLTLAHDTRDHQTNPWYGHYVSLGAQVAPVMLPHGHSFEKVILDARGFVSAAHRHIVAGRLLCQQAFGDVPFYYLPEFGGDTLGRGYLPFRFRDRVSVVGQLEYRFPVWSWLSGAVFADFGQFQPAVNKLRLDGFHPSVGFGPRFNFGSNESSIVGIDVGFTPEGWNLVLHNGHVF